MKTQNFSNHTQNDRMLYFITVLWGFFAYDMYRLSALSNPGSQWTSIAFGIFTFVFIFFALMKMRTYATKLQDRIIRQEINFRYYVATGKILPESLTVSQIVALRFAGDDEFLALVDQVIKNPSLSNKEIKKLVKNRKWDYSRV